MASLSQSLAITASAPETYQSQTSVPFRLPQPPICKAWCTYCDLPSRLLLSINYFAMVHDDGVSCSALARGPSDRLRELGTRVAEEELW